MTWVVCGQKTYLIADGHSPGTYNLLNRVLGGTAYEVPDCIHPIQHITQQTDAGNVDFNFYKFCVDLRVEIIIIELIEIIPFIPIVFTLHVYLK